VEENFIFFTFYDLYPNIFIYRLSTSFRSAFNESMISETPIPPTPPPPKPITTTNKKTPTNLTNRRRVELQQHGKNGTGSMGKLATRTSSIIVGDGIDSGVGSIVNGGDTGAGSQACPVLDLIFDPDLNAYYHPSTQEYYRVAAGY
jgi:hypothetical protein